MRIEITIAPAKPALMSVVRRAPASQPDRPGRLVTGLARKVMRLGVPRNGGAPTQATWSRAGNGTATAGELRSGGTGASARREAVRSAPTEHDEAQPGHRHGRGIGDRAGVENEIAAHRGGDGGPSEVGIVPPLGRDQDRVRA